MLRCNQRKIDRELADKNLVIDLFSKTLSENDINVDKKTCDHVLMEFLSKLMLELYERPENYFNFGKFTLHRDSDLNNLLVFQVTEGNTARTIFDYYAKGGHYAQELEVIVSDFVNNLASEAVVAEKKITDKINELTELSQKAQKKRKKNEKGERKDGI